MVYYFIERYKGTILFNLSSFCIKFIKSHKNLQNIVSLVADCCHNKGNGDLGNIKLKLVGF